MPEIIIPQRFAQRRGTPSEWAATPSILYEGEIGFELDDDNRTVKWKIGDGVTPWPGLPYFSDGGDGSVQMQATATHIQWRASAEDDWEDLVALDDLRGPAGEDSTVPGPIGPAGGPSGIIENTGTVTIDASHKNNWLLQSSGDVTFPVPSSIGFVNGDFVNVRRQAGTVGFVAGTGATLDFNDTLFSPSINALKDSVAVVAHGDTWMLVGPLEAL